MITETQLEGLRGPLMRAACRYRCGTEDREDLVSLTLYRVWRVRDRLDGADLEPYARRVLHRCYVDLVESRGPIASDCDVELRCDPLALARLLSGAAESDLINAIRQLPSAQRDAVVLVAIEGMSQSEAARKLRIAEECIRKRLSRARQSLQPMMSLS
jgi:RNA polymerase sigma-70 factor, ECF subfamily